MPNLTDTQRILLSAASQRESGSIQPLPTSLKPGGGVGKAIDAMVTRRFADEREASEPSAVRRTDGDLRRGVFITAACLAAIGVDVDVGDGTAAEGSVASAKPPAAARTNKIAVVLDLLHRLDGATVSELIEATGWLPHTTRAALTGLRMKGHEVVRGKRDGVTCCSVAAKA